MFFCLHECTENLYRSPCGLGDFHCDMEREMDKRDFATNLRGFLFYLGDP